MDESWIIIIPVAIAALALIIFLIVRNLKDAQELKQKLINEEKTSLPKEDDTEIETND
jgi:large-conductance mechanosensitive channel